LTLPFVLAVGSAVALSVSPARVALVAPASRTVELRNNGGERVVVDVSRRSVDRRGPKPWLTVRPAHVVLRAGASTRVTLRAGVRSAAPGDHQLLLLLVGRSLERRRVAVQLRLGVPVRVRMPGRILRRLDIQGLRVRRHRRTRELLVSLTNLGNVTEQLRDQLSVTLIRGGRVLSRLRTQRRELFPGVRTVVRLLYTGRLRGPVTAVVKVHGQARRYHPRL
jgi:hypothetical protein